MALWERHIFSIDQLQMINFLNGALIGTTNLAEGAEVDGLTFIVDIGGGDVVTTFTPAKSRAWTVDEIVAKINASVAGVAQPYSLNLSDHQGRGVDRRFLLVRDGAFTVKSTGTANALLGFSTTAHTVQVPVASSEVQSIDHNGITNAWHVTLYR
jgi:hypothetical protein